MSAEMALDKAKSILETVVNSSARLVTTLSAIDAETSSPSLTTPTPRSYKVGDFLGSEEILAEVPAVTLEARTSIQQGTQEEWVEMRHTLWVWAYVTEVDRSNLHRYTARYAEALRRLLFQRRYWGSGWHNPVVVSTIYSRTFQAGHALLQGVRVEVQIDEVLIEDK